MSDQLLKQAAGALKSGDRSLATQYIKQHLRANPRDVRGWWAIAQLIEDPQRKIQALERVLAIDPGHEKAQRLLSELQPSSASFFDFNADEDDPELSGSLFDDEMPGAKMGAAADLGEPEFGSVRSTKAAKPARVAARRRLRISSSDILIGAGVVFFVLAVVAGIGFYAYQYQHMGLFGLFGPDLDTPAETESFTIRYPGEWQGRVVSKKSFIAASDDVDKWYQLVNLNLETGDLLGNGALPGGASDDLATESVVVMMTPFTSGDLVALQRQTGHGYDSFQAYLDVQFDAAQAEAESFNMLSSDEMEFEFETEREEIKVDGKSAVFSYQTSYFKIKDGDLSVYLGGLEEWSSGFYVATVEHNGQEYVFMLMAYGEDARSHKRTARRMLRTIKFDA